MGAEEYLPEDPGDLEALRRASMGCRGCGLYRDATQTVFGRGTVGARLLLVGEQPGDREDRQGQPFVGPAGTLLDRALDEAGIDRGKLFLTNAVKHFKWVPSGGRRLHKTPSARERAACRPWLLAELRVVAPALVVGLGATACQSLLGSGFRLSHHRQELVDGPGGLPVVATIHPSAVLRMTGADRSRAFDGLVEDLRFASTAVS